VLVSAKISRSLKDELERRALASDRSLSAEIRRALQRELTRDPENEEMSV
jgi:hypothetical protein